MGSMGESIKLDPDGTRLGGVRISPCETSGVLTGGVLAGVSVGVLTGASIYGALTCGALVGVSTSMASFLRSRSPLVTFVTRSGLPRLAASSGSAAICWEESRMIARA